MRLRAPDGSGPSVGLSSGEYPVVDGVVEVPDAEGPGLYDHGFACLGLSDVAPKVAPEAPPAPAPEGAEEAGAEEGDAPAPEGGRRRKR